MEKKMETGLDRGHTVNDPPVLAWFVTAPGASMATYTECPREAQNMEGWISL